MLAIWFQHLPPPPPENQSGILIVKMSMTSLCHVVLVGLIRVRLERRLRIATNILNKHRAMSTIAKKSSNASFHKDTTNFMLVPVPSVTLVTLAGDVFLVTCGRIVYFSNMQVLWAGGVFLVTCVVVVYFSNMWVLWACGVFLVTCGCCG